MKKSGFINGKFVLGFVWACVSFFSCTNDSSVIGEIQGPLPSESNEVLIAQELGKFHNDVLGEMLKVSDEKKIKDFNGFMKQIMDVSQVEMCERNIDYHYTSDDSIFVSTTFRVFKDLVIVDKQQALDFLVLVSDYPEDIKTELMKLTREAPDVESFVDGLNRIIDSKENTRSIGEVKTSFDAISSIAMSSNEFWSKRNMTRTSFGTYMADGLGGAAAFISGVGTILTGVVAGAASFLWEKAMEPCYTEQKSVNIVVKPNEVLQVDRSLDGRLKLIPVNVSKELIDSLKTELTIY